MTPEEEKVIETALGWMCPLDNCAHPICIAARALKASLRPKKPMSAEDRWAPFWKASGSTCMPHDYTQSAFIAEIRAAESAAWDRAIEAVRARLHEPATWLTSMLLSLKGRCHEQG